MPLRAVAVCFGSRSRRRSRSPAPRSERSPRSTVERAHAPQVASPDARAAGAASVPDHERRQPVERTARARTPRERGGQAAAPGASRRRRRDPFTAELDLLQRAHGAYTRRDFSVALTLVAEHARRFPNGHLAEQREALRVRSLAGAGRADEAHRAAAAFAVRFPRSVLLPRVAGGAESSRAVIVPIAAWPARLRRRSPSIVAGAVWTRSPRGAFDRAARIRGGPRLSRRRGFQGRRHRPAGLRPVHRKRARAACWSASSRATAPSTDASSGAMRAASGPASRRSRR